MEAVLMFSGLIGGLVTAGLAWVYSGRLTQPSVRLAVRSLLLAIPFAPVPLFSHGFGVLPAFMLLLGGYRYAGYIVVSILVTWIAFYFIGLCLGGKEKLGEPGSAGRSLNLAVVTLGLGIAVIVGGFVLILALH